MTQVENKHQLGRPHRYGGEDFALKKGLPSYNLHDGWPSDLMKNYLIKVRGKSELPEKLKFKLRNSRDKTCLFCEKLFSRPDIQYHHAYVVYPPNKNFTFGESFF